MTDQPDEDFNPTPGLAVELAPGLRRILAPNPSPMTYRGTNTYILGTSDLAVIDPGPDVSAHLAAILAALEPHQRVSHIIITHTHVDHSPLAPALSAATNAPVLAFGNALAGRSDIMTELARTGLAGGGEGIDTEFSPDRILQDGQKIDGNGWSLDVIHTPGHLGNHIALGWNRTCFTGDHVMGWASSLVSPPDGDLTDFMTSCQRLKTGNWRVFHPGHGAPVTDPMGRLDWLISHRLSREAAILRALDASPATARSLAALIYADIAPGLLPAAERNVFAHLIDLTGKSLVSPDGALTATATFARTG